MAFRQRIPPFLTKVFQRHRIVPVRFSSGKESGENTSYWKSLKWFSIPASVGFAYIAYLQFRHIQERERRHIAHGGPQNLVLEEWQVNALKKLPTRVLSRWWGYLSHLKVPVWLRKPLFGLYATMYDCNMDESMIEDLKQFPTFSEFFKRKLRPDARFVDQHCDIVSPVDGRVLYFGEIDSSYNMEQVKGVAYSLVSFCGPKHPLVKDIIRNKEKIKKQKSDDATEKHGDIAVSDSTLRSTETANVMDKETRNKLYYCIMYLAPGDYHWFHSPSDWVIEHRRHIPGHLFSVSPAAMRSVAGLFNFNERVLLYGHWKHGNFLMAAIGAYNVGSIQLPFAVEKNFKTNVGKLQTAYNDRLYGASGFSFQRGETLGGFDLGSSIVLIFSAPSNMKFHIDVGQKIQYGEPLATFQSEVTQEETVEGEPNNNFLHN